MIEIIQAGQPGKSKSLIEMHQLRKVIFKDRMGWDVDILNDELEIDNYDLPETIYIIVRDEKYRVAGIWRMLPSKSPSMIREIWPEFLDNFSMPISDSAWEVSRFGVHSYEASGREHIKQVNKITATLITALLEVCSLANIHEVYTLYNPQVGRSVRKIGFTPNMVTEEKPVDGKPTIVGRFSTGSETLKRVHSITGISCGLKADDLPPLLQKRALNENHEIIEENVYGQAASA